MVARYKCAQWLALYYLAKPSNWYVTYHEERLDETLWNTINMVACEIPPLFSLAVHVPSICLSRVYSQSAIRLSTKSPFLQVSKVGLQSCREGSKRSLPSALPSANISTIRTRIFTTMLLFTVSVRVWLTAELCACVNYKSRARRRAWKTSSRSLYALKHTLYFYLWLKYKSPCWPCDSRKQSIICKFTKFHPCESKIFNNTTSPSTHYTPVANSGNASIRWVLG